MFICQSRLSWIMHKSVSQEGLIFIIFMELINVSISRIHLNTDLNSHSETRIRYIEQTVRNAKNTTNVRYSQRSYLIKRETKDCKCRTFVRFWPFEHFYYDISECVLIFFFTLSRYFSEFSIVIHSCRCNGLKIRKIQYSSTILNTSMKAQGQSFRSDQASTLNEDKLIRFTCDHQSTQHPYFKLHVELSQHIVICDSSISFWQNNSWSNRAIIIRFIYYIL